MSLAPAFQPGGTVREEAVYVERAADRELLAALEAGELCYVLAPRQIGKSSLRVRTARRLRERGAQVATIDLTRIGGHGASEEGWYFGLVQEVSSRLGLPGDPLAFWERSRALTPVHRFARFLREQALEQAPGRLVLFVDELDTVLALPFRSDDFFAALREAHNLRAEDPAYRRLTFCLMGVATPGELVRDSARTPFNVGRAIALRDFTGAEGRALLPALGALARDPDALLERLLGWTAGHPYMTMRLCDELARRAPPDALAALDPLVAELLLSSGRAEDPNLAYAERRLLADPRAPALLRLYRGLLGPEPVAADPGDAAQSALCLTGMAAAGPDGVLRVRNRVFASVFDAAWAAAQEREQQVAGPLQRWLDGGRRDDLVLRGQALEEARRWAGGRRDLSPEVGEFLLAGLAVALREEAERRRADQDRAARERVEGEARALRRTLLAVGALAALALVALGAALFEYRRARAAVAEADLALQREQGALASALARQPGLEEDAVRAGIAAVWPAVRAGVRPPAVARSGLADAVLRAAPWPMLQLEGRRPTADYSPDGRRLAAFDRGLHVFDLGPLPEPRWFAVSDKPLLRAELSPDGRLLAAAARDGEVRVLDAQDGAQLQRLPGSCFAWLGSAQLAIGRSDGELLLAPARGGPARALARLPEPIADLAIGPGGARLFAQAATAVHALGLAGGAVRFVLQHPAAVGQARLSPDGAELATIDQRGAVRFFDAANGAPRGRWQLEGVGKPGALAWSSDGSRLLVAFFPALEVRERRSGAVLQRLGSPTAGYGRAPLFAGGDRLALLGDVDGNVRFHGAPEAGAPVEELLRLRAHRMYLRSLAPSPDGRWLVSAADDGAAQLLPLLFQEPRLSLPGSDVGEDQWDPAGLRILSTEPRRGSLRATDAATGASVEVLVAGGLVCCGAAAPDGRFAALQRQGGVESASPSRVLLFGGRGAPLALPAWPAGLTAAAPTGTLGFSPDGAELLVGDGDRVRRLELPSGRELPALEGVPASLLRRRLSWSPDGRRVALAATSGEIDVFDRPDGRRLLSLKAGRWPQVAFSLDGLGLFAGDHESAREWDAATGEALLTASVGPASTVAVSAAGEVLLSESLRRFPLGLSAHLRAGCLFLAARAADGPVREACASPAAAAPPRPASARGPASGGGG